MIQFLAGKKTYILGILGIVYAASGFLTGNLDSQSALGIVWAALTAMGLRAGISQIGLPPSPPQ